MSGGQELPQSPRPARSFPRHPFPLSLRVFSLFVSGPLRPILHGPMRIEKNLAELGDRLSRAREDLRIVEEQVAFQSDVLEEAKTRMLVSETPLADQEYRVARDDHRRLLRERDRVLSQIVELQREQDRLLDLMLGSR